MQPLREGGDVRFDLFLRSLAAVSHRGCARRSGLIRIRDALWVTNLQIKDDCDQGQTQCKRVRGASIRWWRSSRLSFRTAGARSVFEQTAFDLIAVLRVLLLTNDPVLQISFELRQLIFIDGDVGEFSFVRHRDLVFVVALQRGRQDEGEGDHDEECTDQPKENHDRSISSARRRSSAVSGFSVMESRRCLMYW